MFRRQFGVPAQVIAFRAYVAFVILLRNHKMFLGVFHCVGFGILVFFAWKVGNSAGVFPALFTVWYVWSVCNSVAAHIRSRRDRDQSVVERGP